MFRTQQRQSGPLDLITTATRARLALLLPLALACCACASRTASGLNIVLVFNAGASDTPSFDSNFTGLDRMFEYAEDYYQDAFPDSHTLTVNYWYDDLGTAMSPNTLGIHQLVTQSGGLETEANIRIDTRVGMGGAERDWYIDANPSTHTEFDMEQTLWGDLSANQQNDWYNNFGAGVPDNFEAGFTGDAPAGGVADGITDMLSVVLHEVGHALGMSAANTTTQSETTDGDYDYDANWVFDQPLAVETANNADDDNLNIAHTESTFSLMTPSIPTGRRRLPSHTDLFAMASTLGFNDLDVPRREFYGNTNWQNDGNWSGATEPGSDDEAFIRGGRTSRLSANGVAGSLNVLEGGNFDTNNFKLDVTGDVLVSDADSDIFIEPGGELEARDVDISNNAEIEMSGGLLDVRELTIDSGTQLESTAQTPTVDVSSRLRNNGQLVARGNSTTTFISTASSPWDLDGTSGNGVVNLRDGNYNFASGGLADDFDGDIFIDNFHSLTFAEDWTVGSGGRIVFEGSGSISGGEIDLAGDLEVQDGTATINANLDMLAGSDLSVAAGDFLLLNGLFTQRGHVQLGAGAIMNVNDDALITVGATGDIDGFLNFNSQTSFNTGTFTGDGRIRFNNSGLVLDQADIDIGTLEVGGGNGVANIRGANVTAGAVNVFGDMNIDLAGVVQVNGPATINGAAGGGEIDINDAGSQFNADSLTLGTGSFDSGRLDVQTNGAANITGDLNVGVDGQGDVFIAGDGAVNVGGATTIGDQDTLVVFGGTFHGGDLNIGDGGIATLNGGTMEVDSINRPVGATFNHADGILRVTGGDSDFRGSVAHGSPDNPIVRIQDGSDFSVQFAWRLGLDAGDFANLIVVGTDGGSRRSQLRGTGGGAGADLVVGRNGNGVVLVNSGGLIDLRDDVVVGEGATGFGQLTVAGVSNGFRSTVETSDGGSGSILDFGVSGTSIVTVQTGGLITTSSDLLMARGAGSESFLTIGGAFGGFDSEVLVGDDIFVGGGGSAIGGDATINLNSGGRLTGDRMLVWDTSAVNVGGGELILNTLDTQPSSLITINSGQVTTGNANLASGNTLDLSGGTFELQGGDGNLGPSTYAYGGSSANVPTIRVSQGGDLATGALLIGNATGEHGAVHVTGTNADGSRRSSIGTIGGGAGADLRVGQNGTGTLLVEDGGLVAFSDDVEIARESVDSVGRVTVRGVANTTGGLIRSELRSGDTTIVGRLGDAELNIEDGGLVMSADNVSLAANPVATAVVNVGGSLEGFRAELDATGRTITVGATTGGPGANATLNLNTGGLVTANLLDARLRGEVNLAGGELEVNTLNLTSGGVFNMTGGLLSAGTVDGNLAPTGGAVTPGGQAPGTTLVTGDFSPGSGATLRLDLDGLLAGSEFDLLNVTGAANLEGALGADLGFGVSLGDTFEVLTASSIVGTFDDLLLTDISGFGLDWNVIYGATSVMLEVIDLLPLLGDSNGDGVLTTLDIDPFVLAISDPAAYMLAFPGRRLRCGERHQHGRRREHARHRRLRRPADLAGQRFDPRACVAGDVWNGANRGSIRAPARWVNRPWTVS